MLDDKSSPDGLGENTDIWRENRGGGWTVQLIAGVRVSSVRTLAMPIGVFKPRPSQWQ